MDDEAVKDDVDVFVSPRHFGGRTPGAKATKQKVFEEEQAAMHSKQEETESESGSEGIRYKYDSERGGAGDFVHRTIGKNDTLRKVVWGANYFLAVLGIVLAAMAIWVLVQNRNGGVFSFASKEGLVLKSPLAFGILFLAGAAGCIFAGFFIGVPHIATSIIDGFQMKERRTPFIWYVILSASTIAILAVIFVSSLYPLLSVKKFGITKTAWQRMSASHPASVCDFEVKNNCAGTKDSECTISGSRSVYKRCPGHHCVDNCKALGPTPQTEEKSCSACFSTFADASELRECKSIEEGRDSSRSCLSNLEGDVRHFFTVIVATSGTALILVFCITMLGILGPIFNSLS